MKASLASNTSNSVQCVAENASSEISAAVESVVQKLVLSKLESIVQSVKSLSDAQTRIEDRVGVISRMEKNPEIF